MNGPLRLGYKTVKLSGQIVDLRRVGGTPSRGGRVYAECADGSMWRILCPVSRVFVAIQVRRLPDAAITLREWLRGNTLPAIYDRGKDDGNRRADPESR